MIYSSSYIYIYIYIYIYTYRYTYIYTWKDVFLLTIQADKKASKSKGGFFSFGSSSTKYEEAAETYIEAANAFRLQKLLVESGQAFEKAAEMQLKSDEKDDAANTLVEAYKVYRRDKPQGTLIAI